MATGVLVVALPGVPGDLPVFEPVLPVEVFPVEFPTGPCVFVVVEPVFVFDVVVLPVVVVVFEPVVPVEVFPVEVPTAPCVFVVDELVVVFDVFVALVPVAL